MTSAPTPSWLPTAPMVIEGALREASNVTLRVQFSDEAGELRSTRAVYKPVKGERPLQDFPDGTLAGREASAYLISEWGNWGLVPPTIVRDGPLGVGSVQLWVDVDEDQKGPASGLLDVFAPDAVPEGWLPLVQAQGPKGEPLVVAHADEEQLLSLAVLDTVLNNADRKAAHIAVDVAGRVWGFDHGLCAHDEPKLRTVLWGWAGQPLPAIEIQRLHLLHDHLNEAGRQELLLHLDEAEVEELAVRVDVLLSDPVFPELPADRYPLPWPLW